MNEEQIIIGGQAVIEGVMMRAPHSYAVAVRRGDGTIVTRGELIASPSDKNPMLKLPLLRGAAVLIQSRVLGIKALNFAAGVAYDEAQQELSTTEQEAAPKAPFVLPKGQDGSPLPSQHGQAVPASAGTPAQTASGQAARMPGAAAVGSIVVALSVNVLLFILLPLLITNVLFVYLGSGAIHGHSASSAWYAVACALLSAA